VFRTLFVSSRPLSWVNTAFPFAAVYVLTAGVDITLVIGAIYFLIPYNLAMYGINDVFDYESDLRNPRKGGVEGAVLDRSMHRPTLVAVAVTNVPFLAYLLAVGSPWSWFALAVSIFAVIAYSAKGLRFKEKPFLDSLTSSTHFVSPAVYALVLAGAAFTPQLLALLGAFFLWGHCLTRVWGRCKTSLPIVRPTSRQSPRSLAPARQRASQWSPTSRLASCCCRPTGLVLSQRCLPCPTPSAARRTGTSRTPRPKPRTAAGAAFSTSISQPGFCDDAAHLVVDSSLSR